MFIYQYAAWMLHIMFDADMVQENSGNLAFLYFLYFNTDFLKC